MRQPTAQQVVDAIRKWAKPAGVKVVLHDGWNYRGRAWSYGIRGVVEHHWAGIGDGGLEWMAARDGSYPYCNAAIRRDGSIHVLSALSAWGSGTGGPWAAAGVPKDSAHLYCWQTEFESWGREKDFTPEMWTAQAVLDCALREVAGREAFPSFKRLINHKDWTNGSSGVAASTLPTNGRKNDTLYDATEFRTNAKKLWNTVYGKPAKPVPAPVPSPAPVPAPAPAPEPVKPVVSLAAVLAGDKQAVLAVQEALAATVGLDYSTGPGVFGPRTQAALRLFQGETGQPATGIPTLTDLRKLGRRHGFEVSA